MANTQGMCTSFKKEALQGIHAFGTSVVRASTTADSFNAALYLTTATIGPSTTVYTSTGEVTGTGYTARGVTVAGWASPTTSGTTAYTTPTSPLTYSSVTLSTAFDTVLIFNTTQGDKAVSVHTFGSQTITAGTLTINMPANDSTNALLRLT